jgi:transcriptional regulator with GAF, ATPase, and Fis domain
MLSLNDKKLESLDRWWLRRGKKPSSSGLRQVSLPAASLSHDSLESLMKRYEKRIITEALEKSAGNQTKAARLLQSTKRVIQYKVHKYNINYLQFRKPSAPNQ